MYLQNRHLLALGLGVCVLSLGADVASGQGAGTITPSSVDGLIRAELSLGGSTATVAFAPALKADDPAHRQVLAKARGPATGRVHVARLQTSGSLRVGTLALARSAPEGPPYDLWLEGTVDGWQLQITGASKPTTPESPVVVGQVALTRHPSPVVSPTFTAALIPTAKDAGQLIIRWGEHEGATDVQFTEPPKQRPLGNSPESPPINRAHDEDNTAFSRSLILFERNETALVLSNGRRFSVSFRKKGLEVDGLDFPRLASVADGAVVQLTEAAVPRLRIDAPLQFGSTTVRPGNHVAGFAGVYGLWLKRVGTKWRLLFNNESDAWGSQHDPTFDVAEVDLSHTQGQPASRPFAVALVPTAADRGRLVIVWGPHEWAADFSAGP